MKRFKLVLLVTALASPTSLTLRVCEVLASDQLNENENQQGLYDWVVPPGELALSESDSEDIEKYYKAMAGYELEFLITPAGVDIAGIQNPVDDQRLDELIKSVVNVVRSKTSADASESDYKNSKGALKKNLSAYITSADDPNAIDVNALMQHVLREAYVRNTADLRLYAQRMKFFKDQKRLLREHIKGLRQQIEELRKIEQDPSELPEHDPNLAVKLELETTIRNLESKLAAVGKTQR